MSRADEIFQSKLDLIDNVPDNFLSVVERESQRIYQRALTIMDRLDIEDGLILQTEKNYALIAEINNEIRKVLNSSEYIQAVASYADSFTALGNVNEAYFIETFGDAFTSKNLYQQPILNAQRQAVEMITSDEMYRELSQDLNRVLNSSISSGARYSEFVIDIRNVIVGQQGTTGRLKAYAGQIVTDAYSIADRNYILQVSQDLKIERFVYAGGKVKDTRDFCSCRNGKTYTTQEIMDWGKTDYSGCGTTSPGTWQGRISGTNQQTIFSYLGGYNCRHVLRPI